MFDSKELTALDQQQLLLVAEADLRRRTVLSQAVALRQDLNSARTVAESTLGRSLLVALGTAAGVFAWRKTGSRFKWIPWIISAWKFARRFSK